MTRTSWLRVGAVVLALGAAGCGDDDDDDADGGGGDDNPEATVSFETQVHPVLVAKCGTCHGTAGTGGWGQADVSAAYESAIGQVNATTPAQSPLLVNGDGGGDHPDALTDAEFDLVERWIEQGALDN